MKDDIAQWLPTEGTNQEVALALARAGYPVFPVRDWRGDGKLTPVTNWPKEATTKHERVASWWEKWPDACVGLATGDSSGVAVLDLDVKNGKDGVAQLAGLGFPDLQALSPVCIRTPSGGLHLYFKNDPRLRTTASAIAPGIDVRANGGFVYAPGSLRDGKRYVVEWAELGANLPDFPPALISRPASTSSRPVRPLLDITPSEMDSILAELSLDIIDDRECWYRLGAALHHQFSGSDEGFDKWMQVSSRGEKYLKNSNLRAERARYDGFGRGSGDLVTMATVLDWAPAAAQARERRLREQWIEANFEDVAFPDEDVQPSSNRLRFLSPSDCAGAPDRGYVVKTLLAPGDIACIYGAPGAGKSLISPHIGYAVAQGRRVFDMRTNAGTVFYVAAEDPQGMRGRVTALKRNYGDAPDFLLVEGVSDLLEDGSRDLKALRDQVAARRPALIFVDTLAMAFPGLDENGAEGMGKVVAVARGLTRHGAAVVLIHHDTKAGTPTPRGHSLLNGALDIALQLSPRDEGGVIRGKLSKNRNGTCDRDIAFKIETEQLGMDADGDLITVALVGEVLGAAAKRKVRMPNSEAAALAILRDLPQPAPEDVWRAACVDGRTVTGSKNPDSRSRITSRAIKNLCEKGIVAVSGGLAWVVATNCSVSANAFDED